MSNAPRIAVNLRPNPALMSRLVAVHGRGAVRRFEKLAEDDMAIDVLGGLIYRLVQERTGEGKRPFDLSAAKDMAAQMIGVLRENQKP